MNLSCFFTNTARQVYSKATETIFMSCDVNNIKYATKTVVLLLF